MKIIYPENNAEIINEIVEKYGFSELTNELVEKFTQANGKSEGEEILKTLPGFKLAELVIRRAQKVIISDTLVEAVKGKLKTTDKVAKQIAQEIEEKIIPFIEIEESSGNVLPPKSIDAENYAEKTEEIIKSDTSKDSYRETIN